jgi:hypothetical protein
MAKQPDHHPPGQFSDRPGETSPVGRALMPGEGLRRLPGLSPAADTPPGDGLTRAEAGARLLLQGVAILGISASLFIVFLVFPLFLTFAGIFHPGPDAGPDLLPGLVGLLLLLLGCTGLLLFRRWAAVLTGGLGWAWLVYACYVKVSSPGPTYFSDPSVPVVTALLVGLPQVATLLVTVGGIVCWSRLKRGV